MNVLFVHGFGGAGGGRMEKALARVAGGGPHGLAFVRWPGGDVMEMRSRALVGVARHVVEQRSIPRGLVRAVLEGGAEASAAWRRALANVPAGALQLRRVLGEQKPAREPVAVVAFSLGCRVVLHAMREGMIAPGRVSHFVFAGSAAAPTAYRVVRPFVAAGSRVTHVYSRRDLVLDRLYPLGVARGRPSGRAPLALAGVQDLEAEVGHRGYPAIAPTLWELAVAEPARLEAPRAGGRRAAGRARGGTSGKR